MLNDEFPSWNVLSPKSIGSSAVTIHMYVNDVDKVFNQAINAGAKATMPLMDAFWGEIWTFRRSFWSQVVYCNT